MTKKALFLRLSPKKVDLIPEKVVFIPKRLTAFLKPLTYLFKEKITSQGDFSCSIQNKFVPLPSDLQQYRNERSNPSKITD